MKVHSYGSRVRGGYATFSRESGIDRRIGKIIRPFRRLSRLAENHLHHNFKCLLLNVLIPVLDRGKPRYLAQCYLTEVTRVMGTICSLYPLSLRCLASTIALLSGSLSHPVN